MSEEVMWVTTLPHPNPRKWKTCAEDEGQRGWKLHAVLGDPKEKSDVTDMRASLCGIRPRYGWGLDLFIEAKCSRCEARAKKLGIVPPGPLAVPAVVTCPNCDGKGVVDSGGFTPWDTGIDRPCELCRGTGKVKP